MEYFWTVLCISFFLGEQRNCVMPYSCSPSGQNVFDSEPMDAFVFDGHSVTFSCSVSGFNRDRSSIAWEALPDTSRKYESESFQESGSVLTSSITINITDRTDHYFRCLLRHVDEATCYHSRWARSIVRYFPRQSEMSCQPENITPLNPGEKLTVNCAVQSGKPPVDIEWKRDSASNVVVAQSKLREVGTRRTLTQELLVTRDLHLQSLTCRVTSEVFFSGRKLECSVGPVKVNHPLQVRVTPSEVKQQRVDETSTLICSAEGFPDDFAFSWFCFPQYVITGCNSTSRVINLTLPCTSLHDLNETDVITISCSVTTSVETSSNTSTFVISSSLKENCQQRTLIETFKDNDTIEHLVLKQTELYNDGEDSWTAQFQCVVSSKLYQTQEFDLQWVFNEEVIYSDDNRSILSVKAPDTFVLSVTNLSRSVPSKVVCEMITKFGRFTAALNVSFNCTYLTNNCSMTVGSIIGNTSSVPTLNHSILPSPTEIGTFSTSIADGFAYDEDSIPPSDDNLSASQKITKFPFIVSSIIAAFLFIVLCVSVVSLFICKFIKHHSKKTFG